MTGLRPSSSAPVSGLGALIRLASETTRPAGPCHHHAGLGRLRVVAVGGRKSWVAGPRPAMTRRDGGRRAADQDFDPHPTIARGDGKRRAADQDFGPHPTTARGDGRRSAADQTFGPHPTVARGDGKRRAADQDFGPHPTVARADRGRRSAWNSGPRPAIMLCRPVARSARRGESFVLLVSRQSSATFALGWTP